MYTLRRADGRQREILHCLRTGGDGSSAFKLKGNLAENLSGERRPWKRNRSGLECKCVGSGRQPPDRIRVLTGSYSSRIMETQEPTAVRSMERQEITVSRTTERQEDTTVLSMAPDSPMEDTIQIRPYGGMYPAPARFSGSRHCLPGAGTGGDCYRSIRRGLRIGR